MEISHKRNKGDNEGENKRERKKSNINIFPKYHLSDDLHPKHATVRPRPDEDKQTNKQTRQTAIGPRHARNLTFTPKKNKKTKNKNTSQETKRED